MQQSLINTHYDLHNKCRDILEMMSSAKKWMVEYRALVKNYDATPWYLRTQPTSYGKYITDSLTKYTNVYDRLSKWYVNTLMKLMPVEEQSNDRLLIELVKDEAAIEKLLNF